MTPTQRKAVHDAIDHAINTGSSIHVDLFPKHRADERSLTDTLRPHFTSRFGPSSEHFEEGYGVDVAVFHSTRADRVKAGGNQVYNSSVVGLRPYAHREDAGLL